MKSLRRLLWAAPVALILVLAQCESSTAPRMPEPDPPDQKDSIPDTAYRMPETTDRIGLAIFN